MKYPHPWKKYLLEVGCLAVLYYLSARLGLLLAFQNTNASPVWPPSGIALFAILFWGYRIWPGILIGAFFANLAVFLTQPATPLPIIISVSLLIGAGNTLEAVAGRFLLDRMVGAADPFDRAEDVFRFLTAALLACLFSACIGPTIIALAGIAPWSLYKTIWFTWWLGDGVGVLVITPLLLTWQKMWRTPWGRSGVVEMGSLCILILLSCGIAFGKWFLPEDSDYPIAFIVIPFLMWTALRFTRREAVSAVGLTSAIAVWETIHSTGPFVMKTTNESLLVLQSFIGVVAVTILVLTAVVQERHRAKEALQRAHDELELRVQERTAELSNTNALLTEQMGKLRQFEEVLRESEEKYRDLIEHSEDLIGIHDMEGTILSINPAAVRQLGYASPDELVGRNMVEFLSPDIRPRFKTYLSNLEQGSSTGLMKVVTRDGQERIWEFRNTVRSEGVEKPVVRAMARDVTEQKLAEDALRENQKLQEALYRIAEEASSTSHLQELYAAIHKSVSRLINAKNFYIALYDHQTETVTFPYHVDDFDPDWEPKTKRKGLTEYVIRTGKPLLVTPETFQDLLCCGEVEVVISNRIDWIGVPLQNEEGTFGMLGVHSYSGDVRFNQRDMEILSFVSQQVASAIKHKQAGEALRSSEERYRALFETNPLPAWVCDMDSLNFLAVNQAAVDHYGYSREEFFAMTLKDIRPPEDIPLLLKDISTAPEVHKSSWRHRKKGGILIDVEITTHALIFENHKARLVLVNDITERKKAEKALKESEEKYHLLAERIPAITYIAELGESGRWLFVSRILESKLGFTPDEWMADPGLYWDRIHPEDRTRVLAQESECLRTRVPFVSEYRMISRKGDLLWFHDQGALLEGNLFQGFLVDITERKRIEELKDELTSIVAHELRTPLTSIMGSLGYLRSHSRLNEREKKLLDMAGRNSDRMLRLVNDLLDLDKIESGKMVFELKAVDLMQAVEHALEINQSYAQQFGVKLALLESLPGTIVLAEPDRLAQVFTNILANASKFSPQNDVVGIRVLKNKETVRVAVTDHGPGIPEEFHSSVFEKFTQSESGHAKKGSGLGLAISKAIMEKMGGKIGFESKVGSGTTFYIDLCPA